MAGGERALHPLGPRANIRGAGLRPGSRLHGHRFTAGCKGRPRRGGLRVPIRALSPRAAAPVERWPGAGSILARRPRPILFAKRLRLRRIDAPAARGHHRRQGRVQLFTSLAPPPSPGSRTVHAPRADRSPRRTSRSLANEKPADHRRAPECLVAINKESRGSRLPDCRLRAPRAPREAPVVGLAGATPRRGRAPAFPPERSADPSHGAEASEAPEERSHPAGIAASLQPGDSASGWRSDVETRFGTPVGKIGTGGEVPGTSRVPPEDRPLGPRAETPDRQRSAAES